MKAVIAIDSFKGSLTSSEAGEAVKEGFLRAFPDGSADVCSIADGGEGTAGVLSRALGCKEREISVSDPLGNKIKASYGIDLSRSLAVMEMSSAAGLTLISEEERDPMRATTYGVGEMIADAVRLGCREIIMGIGGSATNDGGVGMLSALGFRFLDENGNQIPFGCSGLSQLARIETDGVLSGITGCKFRVACDVTNPLCGENGCSAVFAPQKGAKDEDIPKMDKWLRDFAELTKKVIPHSDENAPGTGAAGGLGFALASYLGAELEGGIDLILAATGFDAAARDADIVVTGEGRIDSQTFMGKAPAGVARIAKGYGKPVIAFCGILGDGAEESAKAGIERCIEVDRGELTVAEAMERDTAYRNLAATAEKVFNELK